MSPKCLYEEPDRTFTVRKQKEKDISAHAAVHSKTAYDDVGEYGKAQNKSTAESCSERQTGPISPGAVKSAGTKSNRGSVIPRKVPAWRALFSELE